MIGDIIVLFAIALGCGYSLVLMVLLSGLFKIKRDVKRRVYKHCPGLESSCLHHLSVSVVVAARNEEENVADCLKSLLNQDYPEELYEIILIDDNSIDNTLSIARSLQNDAGKMVQTPGMEGERLRLLSTTERRSHSLDKDFAHYGRIAVCPYTRQARCLRSRVRGDANLTGKQSALDMGIRASRGEIILTTDADCKAPSTWIKEVVGEFEPDVGLVAGFSILDEEAIADQGIWQRIFLKLQSLETLSLYIGSIGSIVQGFAWAGTGNNMAYRREVYDELGGFEALGVTGAEDSMLLQWVDRKSRWRVKPTLSTVYVRPMKTVSEFFAQRNRWASSSLQNRPSLVLFMVLVYLLNVFLPVLIGLCAFDTMRFFASLRMTLSCKVLVMFISLKIAPEFLVVLRGLALFNRMDLLKYFLLIQPFHVVYVLVCGIHGLSKGFVWKGRKYREAGIKE